MIASFLASSHRADVPVKLTLRLFLGRRVGCKVARSRNLILRPTYVGYSASSSGWK